MKTFPSWVVVHVPHDSTYIPDEVRDQFVLSDADLGHELVNMTDHNTHALFASGLPDKQVVRASVSRLVCDVERFERDDDEPMFARGMGAIYTVTHDGRPLRRLLHGNEHSNLLTSWYRPHHKTLCDAVDRALAYNDQAIVIDGHSFPSFALPYEVDQSAKRPQICIGADEFHTPTTLVDTLMRMFQTAGLTTGVNTPFSGTLVPIKHYRQDKRVTSVMIEVRRDLYLDEKAGEPSANLSRLSNIIRHCLDSSIRAVLGTKGM